MPQADTRQKAKKYPPRSHWAAVTMPPTNARPDATDNCFIRILVPLLYVNFAENLVMLPFLLVVWNWFVFFWSLFSYVVAVYLHRGRRYYVVLRGFHDTDTADFLGYVTAWMDSLYGRVIWLKDPAPGPLPRRRLDISWIGHFWVITGGLTFLASLWWGHGINVLDGLVVGYRTLATLFFLYAASAYNPNLFYSFLGAAVVAPFAGYTWLYQQGSAGIIAALLLFITLWVILFVVLRRGPMKKVTGSLTRKRTVETEEELARLGAELDSRFVLMPRYTPNTPVQVTEIRAGDSLWRAVVDCVLDRASGVIIDVTYLCHSEALWWEISVCSGRGIPVFYTCRSDQLRWSKPMLALLTRDPNVSVYAWSEDDADPGYDFGFAKALDEMFAVKTEKKTG